MSAFVGYPELERDRDDCVHAAEDALTALRQGRVADAETALERVVRPKWSSRSESAKSLWVYMATAR